jgi:hypothetical protein
MVYDKVSDSDTRFEFWHVYASEKDKTDQNMLCRLQTRLGDEKKRVSFDKYAHRAALVSLPGFWSTKEDAAQAALAVFTSLSKCPMPVEVKGMVQELAHRTFEIRRGLQEKLSSAVFMQRALMHVAKKNDIPLIFQEYECDIDAAAKDLLTWKPEYGYPEAALKLAGKTSGYPFTKEDKDAPFLGSQSVIYSLFGKENSRSFFGHLQNFMRVAGVQTETLDDVHI